MGSAGREKSFVKSLRKKICAWTLVLSSLTFNFCAASTSYGDSNDEVAEVQNCLTAQGLFYGDIDGYFGESTVAAIKEFQSAIGLPADGICGYVTYALLHAAAYDEIDITTLMNYGASNYVKPGDNGAVVEQLQEILIELGYMDGMIDGVYSSSTAAAVKNFQAAHGLTVDGLCGRSTMHALKNSYYIETSPLEKSFSDASNYQRVIYVEATAYSPQDAGLGLYTARGNVVGYGIISVDPNVIPLGTRVYIPGYGEAIADDTGGAIVGNRIDIAFDTYEEAMNFGRQSIEIYIIDD